MLDSNDHGRRTPTALGTMLQASDGILDVLSIATDAKGTILKYNSRAVEIWGRKPEPGQTARA